MERMCLQCGAVFAKKKSLEILVEHQKKCTKDKPYTDDENATRYHVELLN